MKHWPAMEKWAPESLEHSLHQSAVKVGQDDKGRKLRV